MDKVTRYFMIASKSCMFAACMTYLYQIVFVYEVTFAEKAIITLLCGILMVLMTISSVLMIFLSKE